MVSKASKAKRKPSQAKPSQSYTKSKPYPNPSHIQIHSISKPKLYPYHMEDKQVPKGPNLFRTRPTFLVTNHLELVWHNLCGIPSKLDQSFGWNLLGISVASFFAVFFRTGPTFLVTNYLELVWHIFCLQNWTHVFVDNLLGISVGYFSPLKLDPRFWWQITWK